MGHRVKGYRRNAVYGVGTRRRDRESMGWMGEVNPPGKDGWENSGTARGEKAYGRNAGLSKGLRMMVEEVRKSEGYETNGRGRKGDGAHGYIVYGEYLRVVQLDYSTLTVGLTAGLDDEIVEEMEKMEVRWQMQIEEVPSLEAKRGRMLLRYEARTGRKVRRERSNRGAVREQRGRKRERGVYRRGRVMMERSYREKVVRVEPLKMDGMGGEDIREAKKEAYQVKKREVRKRSAGVVCTEAIAAVVVRSGVRRMEHRRVKRRIRKREGAGREHRRARREVDGRRKAHARKSRSGRRYARGGVTRVFKSVPIVGGYYGYRVTVTGTLNGSRRTKRWVMGRGTVPQSRKESRRGTAEGVAKTSVGTRGIQVGYCYGLG